MIKLLGRSLTLRLLCIECLDPVYSSRLTKLVLVFELRDRGLRVDQQVALPVTYRDVQLDAGYRLDLVVEDQVIVELKAIDELSPIHTAQLLSYLKLSDRWLGLLINFNVELLKQGIKRVANNL